MSDRRPTPPRVPSRSCAALVARLAPAAILALVLGRAAGPESARADVVTTTEGLVLDGRVETASDGAVTVTTNGGVVRLPKDRVKSVVAGEGAATRHAAALAALAKDDLDGRFRLALRAEADGAVAVARDAYASVVALDPEHAAARRALGYERVGDVWLPETEARRRRGLVLFDGGWMLPAQAEAAARAKDGKETVTSGGDRTLADVLRTLAGSDDVLARAARERWSLAPAAMRHATATALLRDRAPSVRRAACLELSACGDEAALKPLLATALYDPDSDVRRDAVVAAASFGHDDTAVPFVRALTSMHPSLVANAGRALASLGDPRGIVYIVKRIISHGESPRAVVEVLRRQSYIRDYDVEVAQASNIANPVVGIATEGIVFDAKVLDLSMDRTVVETVLIDSFNTLSGAHATDVAGVAAWADAHPEKMVGFPPTPASRRTQLAKTKPIEIDSAPKRN